MGQNMSRGVYQLGLHTASASHQRLGVTIMLMQWSQCAGTCPDISGAWCWEWPRHGMKCHLHYVRAIQQALLIMWDMSAMMLICLMVGRSFGNCTGYGVDMAFHLGPLNARFCISVGGHFGDPYREFNIRGMMGLINSLIDVIVCSFPLWVAHQEQPSTHSNVEAVNQPSYWFNKCHGRRKAVGFPAGPCLIFPKPRHGLARQGLERPWRGGLDAGKKPKKRVWYGSRVCFRSSYALSASRENSWAPFLPHHTNACQSRLEKV